MFTGIIQDIGIFSKKSQGLYIIKTHLDLKNCKEGSSISCNGVCLTAKNINSISNGSFTFEVNIGEETMRRTNLEKCLKNNNKINIERSLNIGEEIGGHFVYGHVDNVSSLLNFTKLQNSWEYEFKKNFGSNNKFIVEKGSISINGVSLTIANVLEKSFIISVIDHTYKKTNLQYLKKNDEVNIEFDYLARFILRND
tara:strand:+ start:161 stop:751 length:591 start_codon:yes stop_codon:yes gene_type:complete